ncbi:Helix-turn-helix domain-containing protein [Thermoanaerobacter thermohydrosulfuricus]|jgi:transcriptional regulator with XRE-family HTH domain|uniref:Transcriptional regulator, XRE family n=7 Tax=Thermoanaerobacter TaxID=1754 RepID=B0KD49_THEP3|nr:MULTISPECIES: helix-turn-helix domain-containing protein [Thermoanaerobacter]ABY92259.1 helix-turn-helix domain protein [Thermoanaerobacter sp. X514]ABY94147.1 transcriptional regulator, XRE family [Thermoanaerobacter pseudethanolicus ATCC 33223]ADV79100.1 helix-turn-helix domain protein [Thermoanaerobacter brockii subsp. finnii Ako-1]AEM79442.1 helix-turn-helix domain protein [Thermoanaerobacter wiegelii Rt8.B1]AIS53047.1 helix-turn-helix domain-containing protein [Thermoanaerobacter kivui
MDTVGERIKYARKKNNLTITALSKLTGLSVGNLSDLENNKSMPSSNALIKLKNALNVSIDWLLTGQQIEYVKEEEEKYLSREEFESISEKDKIIFKAFETLPEERKRDIEGYIKVSLNTTDLEEFIKKEKKV